MLWKFSQLKGMHDGISFKSKNKSLLTESVWDLNQNIYTYFISLISVTISTSTFFDGLLVTGLYTSTSVQASQSIGGSSAFGFGKSSAIYLLQPRVMSTWLYRGHQ